MNLIRGAGNTNAALALARQASISLVPAARDWAVRNLSINGSLALLQPKKISDLHRIELQTPLPLEDELRWAEAIFLKNKQLINRFVSFERQFYSSLLKADGKNELRIIDAMEASVGLSFFSLSARISSLQLREGLEKQKTYVESVRKSSAVQNVKFLAYWWGVRSEESTTADGFADDIEQRSVQWPVNEQISRFLTYHLLGRLPAEGQEGELLASSYGSSVCDFYIAFRRLAQAALVEGRPCNCQFLATASILSAAIDDPLLERLQGLASLAESTAWRDYVVSEFGNEPANGPEALCEFVWWSRLESSDSEQGFAGQITQSVQDLSDPSRSRKGEAGLQKLALMLSNTAVGDWLRLFAAQPFPDRLAIDFTSLRRRFYAAPCYDVEGLAAVKKIEDACRFERLGQMALTTNFGCYAFTAFGLYGPEFDKSNDKVAADYRAELAVFQSYRAAEAESLIRGAKALLAQRGKHSRLSLEALVRGTWWRDGLESATDLTVELVLQNPHWLSWLPISELAEEILQNYEAGSATINQAILLNYANEMGASAYASPRSYAIEDALGNLGFLKPSEFAELGARASRLADIHFLYHVCQQAALRRTMIFQNSAELLDDRISVLRWIADQNTDLSDQAEERARDLARSQQVQKGLEVLKGSKLSIDRTQLRQWATENVRTDFNRFKDLIDSGLFAVDAKLRQAVYDVIEKGSDAATGLAVPDNEAASLFVLLLRKTIREMATNPEHGLDAYLSLRIRHGTLSGHLRGPVEREHLITRRTVSGEYLDNQYWLELIAAENRPELTLAMAERLNAFSSRYDEVIDELGSQVIQLRTDEKPRGVLRFEVPPALATSMLLEIDKDLSFDDFFAVCEDTFWSLVLISGQHVKSEAHAANQKMQAVLDDLGEQSRQIGGSVSGLLGDAILRAKGAVSQALDEIVEWLESPSEKSEIALTIRELIDVSLSTLKRFYPDFEPKLRFTLEGVDDLVIPNALVLFTDIFFIIFENVLRYSGVARSPDIEIRSWIDGRMLWFDVRNSLVSLSELERERISAARQRVESGEYKTALRVEGGTGLPKLAKLLGYGKLEGRVLEFGPGDDGSHFAVKFNVETLFPQGS